MATMPGPRTVRRIWLLTVCGTACWLAGIFLAPGLAARGAGGASRVFYALYAPVCHQIPGRSFRLHGYPLAVCGRCLGIYAGFAAGLLFYPLVRGFSRTDLPRARLFVLLTVPLAIDGLAGLLGVWRSPIGLRFATGLVWGILLPYYFVAGLVDLARARRERAAARALEKAGQTK
ncbi:MAG: DUF2085 domain-containing protein [Acidobacteriota bacterium]